MDNWNNIFCELYFRELRVGYMSMETCHKTIRSNLKACLAEYNGQLKELGEPIEVTDVRVSRASDKEGMWKITLVSTSLNLL